MTTPLAVRKGLFSCKFLARLQEHSLHGSQCLLSTQASWVCQVCVTAAREFAYFVCIHENNTCIYVSIILNKLKCRIWHEHDETDKMCRLSYFDWLEMTSYSSSLMYDHFGFGIATFALLLFWILIVPSYVARSTCLCQESLILTDNAIPSVCMCVCVCVCVHVW